MRPDPHLRVLGTCLRGVATLVAVAGGAIACNADRALIPVQSVEDCRRLAPLLDTPDPAHPGYFVKLRSGVDVATAVRAFERAYRFEVSPESEYDALGMFFVAALPKVTLLYVRCNAEVEWVAHEGPPSSVLV